MTVISMKHPRGTFSSSLWGWVLGVFAIVVVTGGAFDIPPKYIPLRYVRKADDNLVLCSRDGNVAMIDTLHQTTIMETVIPGIVNSIRVSKNRLLVDSFDIDLHKHTSSFYQEGVWKRMTSILPQRLLTFTSIGGNDLVLTVYLNGSYICWTKDATLLTGHFRIPGPILGIDAVDHLVIISCGSNCIHIYDLLSRAYHVTLTFQKEWSIRTLVAEKGPSGIRIKFVVSGVSGVPGVSDCFQSWLYETAFLPVGTSGTTGTTPRDDTNDGIVLDQTSSKKTIRIIHRPVQMISRSSTPEVYLVTHDNDFGMLRNNVVSWKTIRNVEDVDIDGITFIWTTGYQLGVHKYISRRFR